MSRHCVLQVRSFLSSSLCRTSSPRYQPMVCRCFSQKNIIRWPKSFQSQEIKSSRADDVKNKRALKTSLSKGNVHSSLTATVSRVVASSEEDEVQDEYVDVSLQDNPQNNINRLHFEESDAGLRETFIVKSQNSDTILEDFKTKELAKKRSRIPQREKKEGHFTKDTTKPEENLRGAKEYPIHQIQRKSLFNSITGEDFNDERDRSGKIDAATCRRTEVTDGKTAHGEYPTKDSHQRRIKRYKKQNIDPKSDVLYGVSPCLLALQHDRRQVSKAFVLEAFKNSARPDAQNILKLLSEKGVEIYETDREELNRLSRRRPHQGVCLEVSRLHFESLSKISSELIATPPGSPVCVLALDQIMDPMNLGALMRSAYFLGVDKVVASRHRCCPLTPTVSKASSGITEVMPVYAASNMESFLQELGNLGWQILGATTRDGSEMDETPSVLPCGDLQLTKPTILLIGSEGFGLRRVLQEKCDTFVTIPPGRKLHPSIDSLNVSVATGILLHSLMMTK